MIKKDKDILKTITQIIRERRAIFPASYVDKKIDTDIINEILLNATYAPTHKLTQPWRFKIIEGEKLGELGSLLAHLYKEKMPASTFSEMKFNKTAQKPKKCSHVIAICMQRDAKERVPEWEEVAAVAMAVQNMWLTAAAHNIGAYWSSPSTISSDACRKFLNLKEGQRCLGFFYMGYHQAEQVEANRNPIQGKIEWI